MQKLLVIGCAWCQAFGPHALRVCYGCQCQLRKCFFEDYEENIQNCSSVLLYPYSICTHYSYSHIYIYMCIQRERERERERFHWISGRGISSQTESAPWRRPSAWRPPLSPRHSPKPENHRSSATDRERRTVVDEELMSFCSEGFWGHVQGPSGRQRK